MKPIKIAVASGKGGTGKTFLATNLTYVLNEEEEGVTYLDCDVEEPNGHLFLPLEKAKEEEVKIKSPLNININKCDCCGKCSEVCAYNAIALINDTALLFPELCHVCGACSIVCQEDAIEKGSRTIGRLVEGESEGIKIYYGLLKQGEGGMTPRLIKKVKNKASKSINILDSPPGTSCSAVEAVSDCDLCVLITDLTPFSLHDLKLSTNMCRAIGIEPVVIINRKKLKDPGVRDYCLKEDIDIVGEIPDDRKIAEVYSKGEVVVRELPEYREIFGDTAQKLIDLALKKRPVKKEEQAEIINWESCSVTKSLSMEELRKRRQGEKENEIEELVVISGKGGTGKTSVVASFAALAKEIVVADCDVDASDLHLILEPKVIEEGLFSGGNIASIDQKKCTGCGKCFKNCQFEAILKKDVNREGEMYEVDELSCEGCGVCDLVCDYDAVELNEAVNGKWYISKINYGYMSHARLGVAEENSGRLVTLTRQNASDISTAKSIGEEIYIDGSPGTGCPVIASLTGVNYALVVTEPTVSGIHDLERILDLCKFFGIKAGVLVNKWDINPDKTEEIKKRVFELDLDYLGSLPYDENVIKAQIEGYSIIEYAPDSEVAIKIKECFEKLNTLIG